MQTQTEQFDIKWRDSGKEPRVKPNPDYPEGIHIVATAGRTPSCTVPLPYPAKRIGSYIVTCRLCGVTVACTTAGRPDDPRSMTFACKASPHAN